MKKNVIAIVLTVVLAIGNISLTPVLAAEMTDEKAVTAAEDSVDEPEKAPEVTEEATEIIEDAPLVQAAESLTDEPSREEEDTLEQEDSVEEGSDEQNESADTAMNPEEPIDFNEAMTNPEEDAIDIEEQPSAPASAAATASAPADVAVEEPSETTSLTTIEEATETTAEKSPTAAARNSIEDEYKNAETIRAGEFKTIEYGVPAKYFKFVAQEDGYYRISPGPTDYMIPYAVLYNSKRKEVDRENGRYWDLCFYRLDFYSKKGQTWYIEVNGSMDEEDPESYYVHLWRFAPGKTTRGDMYNQADDVKVTWNEVPGARYYKVYREGVTTYKETRTEPVIVTTRTYGWDQKPGLTDGHAYRYRIVASLTGKRDSDGDSPVSYSKVMYRLKNVAIKSVQNTAPGKATVKYDKTTSGDSYVLQYSDRKDMSGATTLVIKGANTTTKVLAGLKKGKTYYIQIRVRKKVNGVYYYTTFSAPQMVKIEK